jgi:hypothetical protein
MAARILEEIVDARRERIARDGYEMGCGVPAERPRELPLRGPEAFTRVPAGHLRDQAGQSFPGQYQSGPESG